jgi:hypothetical protein
MFIGLKFLIIWVVLHSGIEIIGYGIETQNWFNSKFGFKFLSFWVVLHIGIGIRGYGIDIWNWSNLKLGSRTKTKIKL